MRRFQSGWGSALLIGLILCAAWLVLRAPDTFEDNRYNLGVARRSALPGRTLRFVEEYRGRYALYPAGRMGLSTLESVGFVEILRSGDLILLENRRETRAR